MTFSRGRKIFVWVVVVFVILVAGLYILGKNSDGINVWLARRQEKALQKWVDVNLEKEKQAYRDDLDGGKTPEETVAMFLTALKAGDSAKAAKFYELPLQEKAKKNLADEKAQYGNFEHSIAYFEEVMQKGTKQCNEKGDGCTFRFRYTTDKDEKVLITGTTDEYLTIPKGSGSSKLISFSLNQSSHVWKISN